MRFEWNAGQSDVSVELGDGLGSLGMGPDVCGDREREDASDC